jgi:fructokinase
MLLVCGEALMDVFAAGDTGTGMALDARVGGSPFNVAVGLARLGQPVGFFGAVSRGFLGERLMASLRAEGVDTATTTRTDAPTTLSLVGMDAQGVPSYAFYGAGAADRQLLPEALAQLPPALQAVHLGSYTAVVEPVAATLRQLVERVRAHTLVSYDPNVRLNVEPDLGPWQDMLGWMQARCHLLKISDEDLGLLLPGTSAQVFAEQSLAAGVGLVVVTRGGEGAQAWTRGAVASAASVPVKVVDTVGAGDTLLAALLTWLAENGALSPQAPANLSAAKLTQMLQFGVRAAAITCSRRGADLPRRAELAP